MTQKNNRIQEDKTLIKEIGGIETNHFAFYPQNVTNNDEKGEGVEFECT